MIVLDSRYRTCRFVSMVFACALGVHAAALAGPLAPPAGVPTSTGKSTSEIYDKLTAIESLIEPGEARIPINEFTAPPSASAPGVNAAVHRITQPGSYYLTGNISVSSGKSGIMIAASDVTIDLNGYGIVGSPGSFFGVQFASTSVAYNNITVRNGTIRSCGNTGLNLFSTVSAGALVENITASNNGAYGIFVPDESRVINCSAIANTSTGFQIGNSRGGVATNCIASNNGADGIYAVSRTVITNCRSRQNSGRGILAGFSAVISGCTLAENAGGGIFANSGSQVRENAVTGNTAMGIEVNDDALVSENTVSISNSDGIKAGNSCRIFNNLVVECGLNAGTYAINIAGNTCRVEGNTVSESTRGVRVQGTGSMIVRNAVSLPSGVTTTAWTIAAGNRYGPIVDLKSLAPAAAVSGGSATSTLTTTDPNANFTH
ncbi:MAG: right-handed parallel beta-helix repeat-containing protein [Phycisphaerales bacterium]|nr:right-handed parallel beta-helix repeat-containing protein [Phycisphaerales bacterium]